MSILQQGATTYIVYNCKITVMMTTFFIKYKKYLNDIIYITYIYANITFLLVNRKIYHSYSEYTPIRSSHLYSDEICNKNQTIVLVCKSI